MARKKTKSTRASRKTIDDMHYGPEPMGVDYFENNNINNFFSWYTYFYDRNRCNQIIMGYAKEHGYKNANKFKKLYIPTSVASIIRGLENGLVFPDHKDYHRYTDTYATINEAFFIEAVKVIIQSIENLDQHLYEKSN